MEILILLVLFGMLAAVFATQNPTTASIILLGYSISDVPMYLIVSGSLLLGLLSSSILSIVSSVTNSFKLHGKDVKIKETKRTVADLVKINRELELEIVKLKERTRNIS